MGVQLGKGIPSPLAPPKIPIPSSGKEGPFEKGISVPAPLSAQAVLDIQPVRHMPPDVLPSESSRPALEETRSKAMPLGKATPAPAQTARVSWDGGEKSEEEKKKAGGRTLFSRMFEKKKQESPPPVEEPGKTDLAGRGKIRIISCGQPRISSPRSLQIPLTMEVEGLEKPLSFNLSINLEPFDPDVG
jgi:hypothetical protein